eukprot:jgi/Mesvir1/2537/Mv26337-RA.1
MASRQSAILLYCCLALAFCFQVAYAPATYPCNVTSDCPAANHVCLQGSCNEEGADCLPDAPPCSCNTNISMDAVNAVFYSTARSPSQVLRCHGYTTGDVNAIWFVVNAEVTGEHMFRVLNANSSDIMMLIYYPASYASECEFAYCVTYDPRGSPTADLVFIPQGGFVYVAVSTPVETGGASFQLVVTNNWAGNPAKYDGGRSCTSAFNIQNYVSQRNYVYVHPHGSPEANLTCGLEVPPPYDPTVWYFTNITVSGEYAVQLRESYPYMSSVYVFLGSCEQLTCIAHNQGGIDSSFFFVAQRQYFAEGSIVRIAVTGSPGSTIYLSLTATLNNSGESCLYSRNIAADSTVSGSLDSPLSLALLTCGQQLPSPHHVTWYVANITRTGDYTIMVDDLWQDRVDILTYIGGCENLTCLSRSIDGEQVQTSFLQQGALVHFAVFGRLRETYEITLAGPPNLEGCTNGPTYSYNPGQSITIEGTNKGALCSRGCLSPGERAWYPTAWFKITVVTPALVTIEVTSATFDTKMHLLLVGDDYECANLTCIADNDDCNGSELSRLQVHLMPNMTYAVAIQGWRGRVGDFNVLVSGALPPQPPPSLSRLMKT